MSVAASRPAVAFNRDSAPRNHVRMSAPQYFDTLEYKKRSQLLVNITNKLHDLGAQCSVDLPCVVVVGNQSAGKSSVMERLTNVRLPRAANTCTKCPAEVRMSTAGDWSCKIKLRMEYDVHNQQLPEVQKLSFCTVEGDNKNQLHVFVSAAQKALLNPEIPCSRFAQAAAAASEAAATATLANGTANSQQSSNGVSLLDDSEVPAAAVTELQDAAVPAVRDGKPTTSSDLLKAADALKFSRNVVVLEISGANVDLSLIDLPGIIQSEQGGDDNVELVQQLVKDYMQRERSIIVAALSCKDDMENQQVLTLARAADPDGNRTIGVLTKADTIEDDTHDGWLRVLKNECFGLELGYYCVVNPTQAELNQHVTLEAATVKEHTFFQTHPVFSSQTAEMKARFGIDALRKALSRQLVELAECELPKIKDAVNDALQEVADQLAELPRAPSSDRMTELGSLLSALSDNLAEAVSGESSDIEFLKIYSMIEAQFEQMKHDINKSRPATWLRPNIKPTASSVYTSSRKAGFWLRAADSSSGPLITLKRVQELSTLHRGSLLPSFHPPRVLNVLVNESKGRWELAVGCCLQAVDNLLGRLRAQLVAKHFQQYPRARSYISEMLGELQSQAHSTTQATLDKFLIWEKKLTATRNTQEFIDSKKRLMEMLTLHVVGQEDIFESTQQDERQSALDEATRRLEKSGVSLELLRLVAGALAYYQLSSLRMIDNVNNTIKHDLLIEFQTQVAGLRHQLPSILSTQLPAGSRYMSPSRNAAAAVLKYNGEGRGTDPVQAADSMSDQSADGNMPTTESLTIDDLMEEDSGIATQRKCLESRRQQLQQVQGLLHRF